MREYFTYIMGKLWGFQSVPSGPFSSPQYTYLTTMTHFFISEIGIIITAFQDSMKFNQLKADKQATCKSGSDMIQDREI